MTEPPDVPAVFHLDASPVGDIGNIFPRYTHVPGVTPHPLSDADGHRLVGDAAASTRARQCIHGSGLQQRLLTTSPAFRINDIEQNHGWRGFLLYDAGYYWEAHEAWEQAWIEAGRTGAVADLWKGLIKLAAAGVKVYTGNATGAQRHLTRAVELFTPHTGSPVPWLIDAASPLAPSTPPWLTVDGPLSLARHLGQKLPESPGTPDGTPIPALMGQLLSGGRIPDKPNWTNPT